MSDASGRRQAGTAQFLKVPQSTGRTNSWDKTVSSHQPKVSALLNGRLANFSSDRLMRLLTALGQDVEIVVRTKPRRRVRGRIRVVETHA